MYSRLLSLVSDDNERPSGLVGRYLSWLNRLLAKYGGVARARWFVPLLMSRSAIHCQYSLTCTHVLTMLSSLTQVVRHIDSLTIDYRRRSTFWGDFSSFLQIRRALFQAQKSGASKSVYCCSGCCEYSGRCCSDFQGAVRACFDVRRLPRCLSIFPSKRFHHSRRTDANFRCSHSSSVVLSPRSTRDAAHQSRVIASPAVFTTTERLSRFTCKPSQHLITCRVNHVDSIIISAPHGKHLTASSRMPFFTHA